MVDEGIVSVDEGVAGAGEGANKNVDGGVDEGVNKCVEVDESVG